VEFERVVGYCPMGCGQTLLLGADGYLVCSLIGCPRPTAVGELLADRETDHVVDFGESAFTVRHPLRERLDDALMTCELHLYIAGLDGPPVRPGRYRASLITAAGGRWVWSALPEEADRG
jgi:hypothetical protein